MNVDGSNVHKLSNDTAMYINADKNYVYYVRNNTIRKSPVQTFFTYDRNSLMPYQKNRWPRLLPCLIQDPCIYASLIGNYIYYLHYDTQDSYLSIPHQNRWRQKKRQIKNHYLFHLQHIQTGIFIIIIQKTDSYTDMTLLHRVTASILRLQLLQAGCAG